MKLKIEYVNKEDLKPYANNAKMHTAEQVEQIERSIRQFGFNDPIAIWHDNEIIEGHGRLLAAMQMDDVKEVPVIRLDDLTDEQRRAYMLVHNKLTMNTDFDFDVLNEELENIENIVMQDYGFNIDDVIEQMDDEPDSQPEVEFSQEILLSHNYIVLYFDNDFDWEVAQDKFGLKKVKDLIPRKGQPTGIGRVIDGKRILQWKEN